MDWSKEAEDAVSKVPFFVRRRVKKRVEEEARVAGKSFVTIDEVNKTRKKYLSSMESEIKGHQVETCFGPGGCPNRAIATEGLPEKIESCCASRDLLKMLKEKVEGQLKFHHEFRISISDCPNSCSRPQIADIGVIGAKKPAVDTSVCSGCGSCVVICKENAFEMSEDGESVTYDEEACIACGKCLNICPTGAITEGTQGYRVQLGGKLGRHPQLARELPGIYPETELLEIIEKCLDHHVLCNVGGERFGEVINKTGTEFLKTVED